MKSVLAALVALAFATLPAVAGSAAQNLRAGGPVVPRSFARMFVAQCGSQKIFILRAPFVHAQQPTATISQPCANGMAFDERTGILAVNSGNVHGNASLAIYRPPYTSGSAPVAVIRDKRWGDGRQLAWDGAGNLWLADSKRVYVIKLPFSASSVPLLANAAATEPAGFALNARAGLLFIGDLGGAKTCAVSSCAVLIVPAPFTGRPAAKLAFGNSPPPALAVDRHGRLFVGFDGGSRNGTIEIYNPPFTNASRPVVRLHAGGPIEAIAFDRAENVYAQLHDTGGVVMFAGPVTHSASAPVKELGCPAGITCVRKNWAGLAFGP